jgi:hypothetical protein
MARMLEEPLDVDPTKQDWQMALLKMTVTTAGLMLVDYSEKQTTSHQIKILQGSRFELNGSFYKVEEDETIQDWNLISNNSWCYVYLRILGLDQAGFYWSKDKPTYQVEKGGWFHPSNNERAILSARKVSLEICRTKALVGKRFLYPRPNELTGTQIATNSSIQTSSVNIEAGWYRIVMTGGRGGNGGSGGSSGTYSDSFGIPTESTNGSGTPGRGESGAGGSSGNSRTFYLWLEEGALELRPGRSGANGNGGTSGSSGSSTTRGAGDGGDGGDGADGESSVLLNNGIVVAIVEGGNGGSGGSGGKGGWGWNTTSTGGQYPTYSAQITSRPDNGSRGSNGSGSQTTVSGSITVYAL